LTFTSEEAFIQAVVQYILLMAIAARVNTHIDRKISIEIVLISNLKLGVQIATVCS
jgi:hypothetical protein